MPYRIDFRFVRGSHGAPVRAVDRLIELGALDVELEGDETIAALMPDAVAPGQVASALAPGRIRVSPAAGRDADSVWVLRPRPIQAGRVRIVPAHLGVEPGTLRLIDTPAFGTGLHPTTALCLAALDEAMIAVRPGVVLDVGTGSGVLALAALLLGARRVLGLDIDEGALRAAAENGRINGAGARLQLARGGPEAIAGTWPLVLANVLAAPLIDMAPALVRRMGRRGRLVLSGIPAAVEPDVDRAYRRLGLRRVDAKTRDGWVALVLEASW